MKFICLYIGGISGSLNQEFSIPERVEGIYTFTFFVFEYHIGMRGRSTIRIYLVVTSTSRPGVHCGFPGKGPRHLRN